jgi:hypothetical protein
MQSSGFSEQPLKERMALFRARLALVLLVDQCIKRRRSLLDNVYRTVDRFSVCHVEFDKSNIEA